MQPIITLPHPALRPYIRQYVFIRSGAPGVWSHTAIAPPGYPCLSVIMHGKELYMKVDGNEKIEQHDAVTFVGQTLAYHEFSLLDELDTLFVIMQPCGPYQLLGIDQREALDTTTDYALLAEPGVRSWLDEVANQPDHQHLVACVENYFLEQLNKRKIKAASENLAKVSDYIRTHGHEQMLIKKVCKEAGFSKSRLERQMKEMTGITPKQLHRIARFNAVLEHMQRAHDPMPWAQLAILFGYFDQAHFIREFKGFYGKTPTRLTADDQYISEVAL